MQHKARKRFGQNFLTDGTVINRIVDAIAPQPEQLIVEIGPGQAALTMPLVESGAELLLLEIDRERRLSTHLSQPLEGPEGLLRFKVYGRRQHMSLSDVMPILEEMRPGTALRIAALAEMKQIPVAPHSPAGPVSTMAGVHLAASIPNFLTLEYAFAGERAIDWTR